MAETRSYVLDGIPTAFVEGDYEGFDGTKLADLITCPCGWSRTTRRRDVIDEEALVSALRFHFTHCSAARPPEHTEEAP